MKFAISSVCQAFSSGPVTGTRVTDYYKFIRLLTMKFNSCPQPSDGQYFVNLPEGIPYVSCGVARRPNIPLDGYVIRDWRGEVGLFAKRTFAAKAESLSVIVYTATAYNLDPQVSAEETKRVGDATHVIVAVLAAIGPKPTISSHRFVRNLAGGNNHYSPDTGYTLRQAIDEAKTIVDYEKEYVVVSD
jgi:hypothetical protein